MSHAVATPHVALRAAPAPASHIAVPRATPSGHYVYSRSGAVSYRPALRHSGTSGHSTRRVLSQDVPGLGFDYSHLAAVGGGRRRLAGHDRRFPLVAYFPFFGGGYYLPLYDDSEEPPAVEGEQAEAVPPDTYEPYQPPPRPADSEITYRPPAAAEPSTPSRPSDEYVFVRRDGTLFFAVAYTWDHGNLRYVSNEGLRHSVAGTALDLDATQQFNEQRGLTFRLPAV